jgi:transposase
MIDKAEYRKRNIIERVVGWFKESRRLLTRFEKLAVNYVAFCGDKGTCLVSINVCVI